jgi:hypothetical protein
MLILRCEARGPTLTCRSGDCGVGDRVATDVRKDGNIGLGGIAGRSEITCDEDAGGKDTGGGAVEVGREGGFL